MNAVGGGSGMVVDVRDGYVGRFDVVDAESAESGFVNASIANISVAAMVPTPPSA
jgi:hypothetical protein